MLILLTLATLALVAGAPAVDAKPPNIGDGCNYFHWHNGNLLEGELPGYHFHVCYTGT